MPQNLNIQKLIVELPLFCQLVYMFRSVSRFLANCGLFSRRLQKKWELINQKCKQLKPKLLPS